jgi:hypothetical protein
MLSSQKNRARRGLPVHTADCTRPARGQAVIKAETAARDTDVGDQRPATVRSGLLRPSLKRAKKCLPFRQFCATDEPSVVEMSMPMEKCKSASVSTDELPLPPARAALAHAIEQLWQAQHQLEKALEPLSEFDRIRAAATAAEANALRSEIERVHEMHAAAVAAWVGGAGDGDRPVLPSEVFEAERKLRQISADAEAAKVIVAIAEEGSAGAAERVKKSMQVRDSAVWAATVEASEPLLHKIEGIMGTAGELNARLQGLVVVLREIGNRDPVIGRGAMSAAEAIESRVVKLRQFPLAKPETAPARALIEQLKSNPRANL